MNTEKALRMAEEDDRREFLERGADEAKARLESDCEYCWHYDRPGHIYNEGAWVRCPMCNPSFAK